jgi:hypothetical protein
MAPSINMVPPTRSVPFQVGTHEIEGDAKKNGAVFYSSMGKCDEISRIFSIIITVRLREIPPEEKDPPHLLDFRPCLHYLITACTFVQSRQS